MSQKLHAYLRVSTDRQDAESQRTAIDNYYKHNPNNAITYTEDHISGKIPWQDRKLKYVLDHAEPHDTIIVSEITRIERNLIGVLTFIHACQLKRISVVAIKSALEITDSLNSKITVAMLALAGEIERDLNNARALAGVQTRRARGLPLGRQPGTVVRLKLDEFKTDIPKWRAKKLSLSAIAKLTDSSVPTVKRWLKRNPQDTTT